MQRPEARPTAALWPRSTHAPASFSGASRTDPTRPRRCSRTASSTSGTGTATCRRSTRRRVHLRWRFKTGGPVKGSVALSGSNVIVGSYDGHVYALDARRGSQVWRGSAQPRFSLSLGTFYSTPAVAYGRVYIGNTDGKIYSYGAKTGRAPLVALDRRLRLLLPRASGTSASTPAPTTARSTRSTPRRATPSGRSRPPARSRAHRRSSTASSTSRASRTAPTPSTPSTGKLLWSFGAGHYTPVVADAKRLYLVGYARLYGMIEKTKKAGPKRK